MILHMISTFRQVQTGNKFRKCWLILLLLSGCEARETGISISEFDIQFEKGIEEKIYTYTGFYSEDTITHHYEFSGEDDNYLINKRIYHNHEIRAEQTYRVALNKKQLIKEFQYEYPGRTANALERVKCRIINYRETEKQSKYAGLETQIEFTNSLGFRTVIEETDEYLNDTTIVWQNESLPAIKFKFVAKTQTYIKYLPFVKDTYENTGFSYYARGIGLIRFVASDDEGIYAQELLSIKKLGH